MKRRTLHILIFLVTAMAVTASGCAYFNTFYNVRKKFAEAERETEMRSRQTQTPPAPSGPQRGGAAPAGQPPAADKYRKVLETGSKLLELYPKSRWVDDVLLIMGICYYRLGDLARAERKFAELMTIFPKSELIPEAMMWKVRTLSEQKRPDAAVALLNEVIPTLRPGPQKTAAVFLLGKLLFDLKRWPDAAENFRTTASQKSSRTDHLNAVYFLGLCLYEMGDWAEARTAFMDVADNSTDVVQAYDATVKWSRCELALHNYAEAEAILQRIRTSERFYAFADLVGLELAQIAVETGRVEDGVALYEDYIANHDNGAMRGLAFYRLALVHRDRRADLTRAKALLDSTTRAGAAKEIADSARAALDLLSKGIGALEKITELEQAIRSLDTEPQSGDTSLPHAVPSPPDTGLTVQPAVPPVPRDTSAALQDTVAAPPRLLMHEEALDTAQAHLPTSDSVLSTPRRRPTPAELAADSILRALGRSDSLRRDSLTRSQGGPSSNARRGSTMSREQQRDSLQNQLQTAFLRAAEFYAFTLGERDSALAYYRRAASNHANRTVYWKANLYLARSLAPDTAMPTGEAAERYRAVVEADSVPVEAANVARRALGLLLIELPPSPGETALREAERAADSGTVSTDSVLTLYNRVIAMDSSSSAARRALFAKANLFENVLHRMDSARVTYEALLKLYPDSSFSAMIHTKLKPPDTTSIFNLSDAQLFGGPKSLGTMLEQKTDESGWPPPEETLRGRRYRR